MNVFELMSIGAGAAIGFKIITSTLQATSNVFSGFLHMKGKGACPICFRMPPCLCGTCPSESCKARRVCDCEKPICAICEGAIFYVPPNLENEFSKQIAHFEKELTERERDVLKKRFERKDQK